MLSMYYISKQYIISHNNTLFHNPIKCFFIFSCNTYCYVKQEWNILLLRVAIYCIEGVAVQYIIFRFYFILFWNIVLFACRNL